ncbi:hypothetical protein NE237_012319 [Protea cynaroides]|uniref:Uncharacterized protein n=1 Tax=Protea cynaroides TaxID=273540 RepID=A0A9Q0GWK1_9MAGN|nr:hypothetical protein NE237_012319 [Protea cynaroides]
MWILEMVGFDIPPYVQSKHNLIALASHHDWVFFSCRLLYMWLVEIIPIQGISVRNFPSTKLLMRITVNRLLLPKLYLNYIGLDGEIGCMGKGAGLAMATLMDINY